MHFYCPSPSLSMGLLLLLQCKHIIVHMARIWIWRWRWGCNSGSGSGNSGSTGILQMCGNCILKLMPRRTERGRGIEGIDRQSLLFLLPLTFGILHRDFPLSLSLCVLTYLLMRSVDCPTWLYNFICWVFPFSSHTHKAETQYKVKFWIYTDFQHEWLDKPGRRTICIAHMSIL